MFDDSLSIWHFDEVVHVEGAADNCDDKENVSDDYAEGGELGVDQFSLN